MTRSFWQGCLPVAACLLYWPQAGLAVTLAQQLDPKTIEREKVPEKDDPVEEQKRLDALDDWSLNLLLTAAPAIGRALPNDQPGTDTFDDSEYGASLSFAKPSCGMDLKFDVGSSISPHLLDQGNRDSTIFGQASISTASKMSEICRRENYVAADEKAVLLISGRYRIEQPFGDLYDMSKPVRHKLIAGVDLKGAIAPKCPGGKVACTAASNYRLTVEVGQTLSSDPTQRAFSPKVIGRFDFPTGGLIVISATATGQFDSYSGVEVTPGKRRFDKTVRAGLSFDFSKWMEKRGFPKQLQFAFGTEYRRRWSNADDKSFERSYLLPSITIKQKLF